ncbi:MAG: VCBS repeat-containing protein, partial [Lentisphaeria bacterium]|nr:VCBS repeat-containing protein [Lentisphaeria bacterium]
AEDYTYSYTVTDSTGKEFNAVANGLEFTLTDVPAAGKLNVSMTVTDAYGETTKYTTEAFAADVADYTAPRIDMLTSVAGKDINVSWIATDETGIAGYEIECNGQVYNLKFPVTGEAVGFDFLDLDEGKYSITVSAYDKAGNRVSSETSTINLQVGAKLLDNGVSQIVAWDAGRGAAGYIATDVDGSAKWVSVGYGMADIWDVVATGKFSGSTVDNDGLLLYNKVNNTFAAWTDLSNATHGYKSLCWVESDFATKCTANLDGDGFDDVLIYNTEGSFGAVLGAATYKDIWHVSDAPPTVELIGAGTFGHEDGLDSLVIKNLTDGSYEMWHNTNINGKKWGWGKVTITPAVEGWEVAAIGDFSGDGIDDIAMWNSNDGEVVLLENGKNDEQTVIGTLNDSKWEISAVGDYNGDGKEDLLLRELTSGYGGLYFANGGDLSSITSLGSSIATDVKDNKFAIIA